MGDGRAERAWRILDAWDGTAGTVAGVVREAKAALAAAPAAQPERPPPPAVGSVHRTAEGSDKLLGAWPVRDVLLKLADAADILLGHYNYDGHGWEGVCYARDAARIHAQPEPDGAGVATMATEIMEAFDIPQTTGWRARLESIILANLPPAPAQGEPDGREAVRTETVRRFLSHPECEGENGRRRFSLSSSEYADLCAALTAAPAAAAVRERELVELREALERGEASDGYHTHRELYEYRMLYNAHAAHGWLAAGVAVVKSRRHSDGEPCFGGGWFIVTAQLATGQVSNHYREKHWDLFDVPAVDLPPEYDGHSPADAADRLRRALVHRTPDAPATGGAG